MQALPEAGWQWCSDGELVAVHEKPNDHGRQKAYRWRCSFWGSGGGFSRDVSLAVSLGLDSWEERTLIRYSTARFGSLKLARMARTTWSRGKPISMILAIAPSSASPVTAIRPKSQASWGHTERAHIVRRATGTLGWCGCGGSWSGSRSRRCWLGSWCRCSSRSGFWSRCRRRRSGGGGSSSRGRFRLIYKFAC